MGSGPSAKDNQHLIVCKRIFFSETQWFRLTLSFIILRLSTCSPSIGKRPGSVGPGGGGGGSQGHGGDHQEDRL